MITSISGFTCNLRKVIVRDVSRTEVRKKVSLPAEKTVLSHESLRSRVNCDVDHLWCSEDYCHVYLLKHHNSRIKEGSKIAISVKIVL